MEFLCISRGLILSVVPRAVKTGRSPSSHWFCVRYEGTFSIYFVKRGSMNPWVTEMETNIVVRIKIVDVYKDLQTFHRLSGKMLQRKNTT